MNSNFAPNLVVGVVITLLGVVLTLDRLNLVEAGNLIRFWPVVLVLFGASVVWQAFRPDVAGEPGRRPRPVISPGLVFWMVVGWMVVSGVGPFGGSRWNNVSRGSSVTGDRVSVVGIMSDDLRVSRSTAFRGGEMTTIMGGSRLDLREAMLAPGEEVVIDVFGLMGRVQLIVPDGWTVDIQTAPVMGRARDLRPSARVAGVPGRGDDAPPVAADAAPAQPATPPRLVVRGFVMMGALVITTTTSERGERGDRS